MLAQFGMFYVYEFRDHLGIPFYIGKGSKGRIASHIARARRGIRSHFYNKLRKLWRAGLNHQAVIVFESLDEDAAFAEEVRLISYYGRANLTNQTDGGDGPSNPSTEVRAKISAGRRGVVAGEATRNRLRLSHLGKKHTAATKARIAAKQRGSKKPWAAIIGLQNLQKSGATFKGRKWSEEHRARFKKARTGHVVTQETRNKISSTKRKRKNEIPIL